MKRFVLFLFVIIFSFFLVASEKNVIDEWSNIKAPDAPKLSEVQIELATTALLILDIQKPLCNPENRIRCYNSIPAIKKLLTLARSKNMLVVYSLTSTGKKEDIVDEVAPQPEDPIVQSSVDKFYKTELEKILSDKGIKTVIITGTAANGAVLHTATGASLRGLKVIVPVDGMSGSNIYEEQYVAYHIVNSPGTRRNAVLTKVDLIKF